MTSENRAALRIFVDGAIVKPQLGGIATYVAGVVSGLAVQQGVSVCVATSVPEQFAFDGVEVIELPAAVRNVPSRLLWRERALNDLVRAHACDVLFSPTIELPLRRGSTPTIVVVHDLSPIAAPSLHGGRLRQLRYIAAARHAWRRADHVICVSKATQAQLASTVRRGSPPSSVIGEAGRLLPLLPRAAVAPPYVLSVGAMLEHKNIETLVRAFDRPSLAGVELRLAGPLSAAERDRLAGWCATVPHPERIEHLGFVEPDRLAELYAGAALVALPSLSEGYGLPMLEAMRAGVPVIASSLPALHELGGSLAVYVDEPRNGDAWADAIAALLADEARRGELERDGPAHVAHASWPDVAAQIASIARTLAAARR